VTGRDVLDPAVPVEADLLMAEATPSEARWLWPSGVSIITTLDGGGEPWGFTASTFCWLSSQPPVVSFFVAHDARSYCAFAEAPGFSVNVLQATHEHLAVHFSKSTADKFLGQEFTYGEDAFPELRSALAALQCRVSKRIECDSHLLVVGDVVRSRVTPGAVPMIHYERAFKTLNGSDGSSREGSDATEGAKS
jgi:flavin reductase ActVB